MKENAIKKGTKDAAKFGADAVRTQDMKVLLILMKKTLVNCCGNSLLISIPM